MVGNTSKGLLLPSKANRAKAQTIDFYKFWYPSIRDTSMCSKFGAHGEHGDVFLFSNLGAL